MPATGFPVYSNSVRTEMQSWERRGWVVTVADSRQVVLEKRNSIPLCLNVLLVFMTAFLWTIAWAVRARKKETQTRVLAITPDGELDRVTLVVGATKLEPLT
ncbi:hypothetical protein [Subtercola endophyticus]|uniref:hypothetical protein n=1 Tax=Subtercola endophyticus TaxID=2895559 RepID=UPI001E4A8D59|nr:hypothetical protein [Subtercola endophyticus]UFS60182.1 hypothetical protein LQ955_05330 [Subtercola endophyticus]